MVGSYNNLNGFGHEDWLFRNEWQIDGWRYAFIQGIGHSHDKLLRERNPFSVTLFTVHPDKRRRYVAYIESAECLDNTQALDALATFKKNGWYATMKHEIHNVQGDVSAFGNAKWAIHVLNVRFRLENVHRFPGDAFASVGDPVYTLNRYVLTDVDRLRAKVAQISGRSGSTDFPSVTTHARSGSGPVSVSPEHARIQAALMRELQKEFPNGRVVREENFIDVLVETADEVRLYEIKSDLAPRTVLRTSIGQLLEYSYPYLCSRGNTRSVTLIAVGRNELSNEDAVYLAHLRNQLGLPLEYRAVSV
jgi:hypothetical protein